MTIKFINSLNKSSLMERQNGQNAQTAARSALNNAVTSALAAVVTVSNVSRSASGKESVPTEYKEAKKIADSLADKIRENPEEAKQSYENIGAANALTLYS